MVIQKYKTEKTYDFLITISNFLIIFIAFRYFLLEFYSVDTYPPTGDQAFYTHLDTGRFITAIGVLVLNFFKISILENHALFNIIYFITTCFSIYLCMRKIEEFFWKIKSKKLNFIEKIIINNALLIGFFNIFSAEWLYFNMMTLQFILCIIFATLAAISFFYKKYGFILSTFFAFLSYNSYQVGIGIFVWLILIFTYLVTEGSVCKKSFAIIIKALIICIINVITNIIIVKILCRFNIITAARYNGNIKSFLVNIKDLMKHFHFIWINGDGMVSFPLLTIFLIILIGLCLYFLYLKKITILSFVYIVFLISGGLLATFSSTVLTPYFWCSPRQIVPLFFVYTFLIIVVSYNDHKSIGKIKYICFASEIFYILCTVFFIQIYTSDILEINKLDKQRALLIQNTIKEYESSSGVKIEFIGFCEDMYPTYKYNLHLNYYWDTATSMFYPEWSNLKGLNFYTKSNYSRTQVPEEVKKKFKDKDWSLLNIHEQIVFENDKCYICNY